MPTYELSVLFRQMARPQLITTIKRTALQILDNGGIIRKLENLGNQQLPYKISIHDLVHKEAHYFRIEFSASPKILNEIKEEYGRDIDIIRRNIFKIEDYDNNNNNNPFRCTLSQELLPPAYRKEVQEMIKIGKRKKKPTYFEKFNITYYPFQ